MNIKNVPKKYKKIFEQSFENHKENKVLKKCDIHFVYGHSKINTFQTRPSILHLFIGKRVYIIVKSRNKIVANLFENLSYDAKVGIITHELCHIIDYEKMNFLHFVVFSFNYLFSAKYRKETERRVDLCAVKSSKKYNWDWKDSHPNNFSSDFERKYWKNINENYLSKEEIQNFGK